MNDEPRASMPTRSHRPDNHADSLTDHSMAKPATVFHQEIPRESQANLKPSYLLKMPGEILNKIARLVLVPGRVTAFTSQHNNRHAAEGNPPNRFSLLATCRQFYRDYALMFYGDNVFCLPPGPISKTELYFDQLLPPHQIMIRHVAVPFSLAGANPSTIYRVTRNPVETRLLRACVRECANTWAVKVDLVCNFYEDQLKRGSQGLMEVILEYGGDLHLPCVILNGSHILQGLTNTGRQKCASKAEIFWKAAEHLYNSELLEIQ